MPTVCRALTGCWDMVNEGRTPLPVALGLWSVRQPIISKQTNKTLTLRRGECVKEREVLLDVFVCLGRYFWSLSLCCSFLLSSHN